MADYLDDPRITAYLLDEMSPDERITFEAELSQSEQLRASLNATASTVAWLRAELSPSPTARLSEMQRAQIAATWKSANRQAMPPAAPSVEPLPRTPARRRSPSLVVVTVVALIGVVGVLAFYPRHDSAKLANLPVTPTTSAPSEPADVAPAEVTRSEVTQSAVAAEESGNEPASGSPTKPDSPDVLDRQLAAVQDQPAAQENKLLTEMVAEPATAPTSPPATPLHDAAAVSPPLSRESASLDALASATKPSESTTNLASGSVAPEQPGTPPAAESPSPPASNSHAESRESRADGEMIASSPDLNLRFEGGSFGQNVPAFGSFDSNSSAMGGYGGTGTDVAASGYGFAAGAKGGAWPAQTASDDQPRLRSRVELSKNPMVAHDAVPSDSYYRSDIRQRIPASSLSLGEQEASLPTGDKFAPISENAFAAVREFPLSTFSIDVDTASYSKVRMYLEQNQLPRPEMVRLEELINYFPYRYAPPDNEAPFAAHLAVAQCPWNAEHQLVRVALKGQEVAHDKRPPVNLVFLVDVSGSMDAENRLPLVQRGLAMLVSNLRQDDRVAMVVYAGAAGLVLDSTPGDKSAQILDALKSLRAGGSTNGGAGIQLAYQKAREGFVPNGINRVVLCTDGDFNVGTTHTEALVNLVKEEAKGKVFLTVLGFGIGNHNDSLLEQLSDKGNGNYAFIDSEVEAHKVLVRQLTGTMVTIAKDVKLQVEFNPQHVASYRLLGYENRLLANADFQDDKKDAGEIGAGHTVTAFYEVVPAQAKSLTGLKYQQPSTYEPTVAADSPEILTLQVRYKRPDAEQSQLLTFPLLNQETRFEDTDDDFRFAAAVAGFGMLLRQSPHRGNATYQSILEMAAAAAASDSDGYRAQLLPLIRTAARLTNQP